MSDGVVLASKIVALAFITTSMASAGLSVRPRDVIGQLRRTRLVVLSLAANFVLAPLVAWIFGRVIPIDPDYATGLLLIGGAAGAPMLPKLAERAHGSVAFAITLMMLLVVGSVAFIPFAMPLVIPGLHASPMKIAFPLIALIVAPLAAGLFVGWRWEGLARRVETPLRHASDVCLIVFVVMVVSTHLSALWGAVGSGAILAAMLFVIVSGAGAFALGGPGANTRRVLALGTGQRNVAAALVTAGSSFSDQPKVVVMLLVTDVVGLVILFTGVRIARRVDARRASPAMNAGANGQAPPSLAVAPSGSAQTHGVGEPARGPSSG